jgi:hypothetical protein
VSAIGSVNKHPAREAWVDGHPELTRISYDPDKKQASLIYEIDGIELAYWQPWHIGGICGPKIERGGCLRALVILDDCPPTGFADRRELFDLLPDDTKQAATALRLRYRLNPIARDRPYLPAI